MQPLVSYSTPLTAIPEQPHPTRATDPSQFPRAARTTSSTTPRSTTAGCSNTTLPPRSPRDSGKPMGHGTGHGNDLYHLRLSQQINVLHAVGGWSAMDVALQHASDSVAMDADPPKRRHPLQPRKGGFPVTVTRRGFLGSLAGFGIGATLPLREFGLGTSTQVYRTWAYGIGTVTVSVMPGWKA